MRDKTTLIIAIHNHQPVGNLFPVLTKATQRSYRPFIKTLNRYPFLKLNLHYSGFLLKWLFKKHPDIIKLLKSLIKDRQVDILGGGIYEPILPSIPLNDAREQLRLLTLLIEKIFGIRPQGFWLAERVWEPQIPEITSASGLKFTFADDIHFTYAGFDRDSLDGYYATESDGKKLFIFPINEDLRYLVPFGKVSVVIDYLRHKRKLGSRCITLAADGEKFGVWPGTYNLVYKRKWLENFFKSLEDNRDWIEVKTAASFIKQTPPTSIAYLPTASYDKMMRWALPAKEQVYFENLLNILKRQREHKKFLPFLKGGFWKNFFVKYPESNNMHKRMFMVSQEKGLSENKKSSSYKRALDFLYRSQCNDAYWHGLFGGLYLPHLREAIYENLIAAENLFKKNQAGQSFECETLDFNLDGRREVMLRSEALNLFFEPAYGGSLFELDLRRKNINLINTLSRKREAYHLKNNPKKSKFKKIIFDRYSRRAFQDHVLEKQTTLKKFKEAKFRKCANFIDKPYSLIKKDDREVVFERKGNIWLRAKAFSLDIKKQISFVKDNVIKATYSLLNKSEEDLNFIFGVEFNFSLYSSRNPKCYFKCGSQVKALNKSANLKSVRKVRLVDKVRQFEIEFVLGEPVSMWYFPVFTISQSEAYLEKIFQCGCFLIHWKLALSPNRAWQTDFNIVFK